MRTLLGEMCICMYVCIDVWLYLCIVCMSGLTETQWHRGLNPFWPHKFGFKPLLGLEPMAPIRSQLPSSHANHSATETSYVRMYVCVYMYICTYTYVRTYIRMCISMYVFMYVCFYVFKCLYMGVCTYIRMWVRMYRRMERYMYVCMSNSF